MKAIFSLSVNKKPLLYSVIVFILVLILTQYLTRLRYLINRDNEHNEVLSEVSAVKDRLKTTLSYNLSATKTLAYIIENYGVPKDFDGVAREILNANKNVDALELTEKGVITHVYPLKENESVIGYDILKDPLTNKEAYKAIEKNELFFAGPFKLKQGGIGIVGRLPVFTGKDFFGFSAVIIKLPTLIRALGIDTLQNSRFMYQLSKVNPNTNKEEFFLPNTPRFKKDNFVSLNIADGEWKLCVVKRNEAGIWYNILFSILGIVLINFSIFIAVFLFRLI